MVNEPAGTTTISGHLSHSLKTSLGLSPHSSPAVSGFGARNDDRDTLTTVALPHGLAGCGDFAAAAATAAPGPGGIPPRPGGLAGAPGGTTAAGGTTTAACLLRTSMRAFASPA